MSYKVDFKVILKECEPFTSIYSEIHKFCKEMVRKNLIKSFKIVYQ